MTNFFVEVLCRFAMAIKHIILLFVETPNFFVLKARRRAGRVVDRKLPTANDANRNLLADILVLVQRAFA
jgi:hypothetical protein